MLTFREIENCEGYYYNRETGDILRNVGEGKLACWSGGLAEETIATHDPETPRFELLTSDVSLPFESVVRLAEEKYAAVRPGRFLNRQTATQANGSTVIEEAKIQP